MGLRNEKGKKKDNIKVKKYIYNKTNNTIIELR